MYRCTILSTEQRVPLASPDDGDIELVEMQGDSGLTSTTTSLKYGVFIVFTQ